MIADVGGAIEVIRRREFRESEYAIILGSGMGDLVDLIEEPQIIPTADLPSYPETTVPGHQGNLVFGRLEGRGVVVVQGRLHCYEGHSIHDVAFPVRLVYGLGARRLLLTNAAGGISDSMSPGSIMFITNHINLSILNPFCGTNLVGESRFTDMSEPYDLEAIEEAERVAFQAGITTHRGVYLWTVGPAYETKAEIRMFAAFGADAVGMSTVPEVLQARYLGMRVMGISVITNFAAGLNPTPLTHEEVLEVGRQAQGKLSTLICGILRGTNA